MQCIISNRPRLSRGVFIIDPFCFNLSTFSNIKRIPIISHLNFHKIKALWKVFIEICPMLSKEVCNKRERGKPIYNVTNTSNFSFATSLPTILTSYTHCCVVMFPSDLVILAKCLLPLKKLGNCGGIYLNLLQILLRSAFFLKTNNTVLRKQNKVLYY